MGLGREAQPVGGPEHRDSSTLQQPCRFGQNGLGIRDMFDDVAAVDRAERAVRERHRFPFAANEPDIFKACFIKPFASQDKPPHGDVRTDEFARRHNFGECDQGTAGAAAQIEDRRTDSFGSGNFRDRGRPGAFEDMPHLATHVRRPQLRAMPLVISCQKPLERETSGEFLQIGGDRFVASVTAVRVFRTAKIGNTGKAAEERAALAIDPDRVPFWPNQIGLADGASNPRGHLARFARETAAGPSSSQAVTTRPTAARLSAEHLSAVSSTVCQWG